LSTVTPHSRRQHPHFRRQHPHYWRKPRFVGGNTLIIRGNALIVRGNALIIRGDTLHIRGQQITASRRAGRKENARDIFAYERPGRTRDRKPGSAHVSGAF
jgi:hypothetical protein